MKSIERIAVAIALSALVATPMFAAKPSPISNSVKYKDAGAKPATGRSGSAAIQVRALRGQANTDIEVTTGQFESATAPVGKLDKVQVKLFGSAGDAVVTDNFRPTTGGYASFAYNWPGRGQNVQVQANVKGIDPKRNDVVTVSSNVKLRPDLTVASLHAATQAYVGSVVTIAAVIREANADLGARANCVLKADGVAIDHANNIWVDAGDVVTVQFQKVFDTIGQKQLTVELTDVVPGDYDTTNNSGSATINIVPTSIPLYYTMDAEEYWYDQTMPSHMHEEFKSFISDDQSYVRDSVGYDTSTDHAAYYGASLQIEGPIQFPVTVNSRLTIDGQELLAASGTIDEDPNSFMGFSGDGYWNRCGETYDGWTFIFACHFHSEFDGVIRDLSTAYAGSNAGAVTYTSAGMSTTMWGDGRTDVYIYNWAGDYTTGPFLSPMPQSLGNNINIHGDFTDAANNHYEAQASVQLSPVPDYTYDYGEQCFYWDNVQDGYGEYTVTSCASPVTLQHGFAGWSSGQQ